MTILHNLMVIVLYIGLCLVTTIIFNTALILAFKFWCYIHSIKKDSISCIVDLKKDPFMENIPNKKSEDKEIKKEQNKENDKQKNKQNKNKQNNNKKNKEKNKDNKQNNKKKDNKDKQNPNIKKEIPKENLKK